MKKNSFYFGALLILVIVIAVLGILVVQRKAPAEPEATDAPSVRPPVEESAAPPAETAAAEAAAPVASEPTPTPTEAPVFETRPPVEAEPEPSPTPTPAPEDASGSFRSDTGTGLNLKVDWRSYTDASGARKLQVDVSAQSYSFFTSALYQSIVLTVDGRTYAANSAEIAYDGSELVTTPMAGFTVDAPAPGSPVSVVWHYKGTYSGKTLDDITASGVIG